MHSNTLKTVIGFCQAFIERRIPFAKTNTSITDIYNYLDIKGVFPTSGQPSEEQFKLIRDAGYEAVINLAPNSILENSVVNEREVLTSLGMEYIHIPVNFKKPSTADFKQFSDRLKSQPSGKVWVHCAANMRVSAFTYRYRVEVLGHNREHAEADLRKIWDPIGVWKNFIRQ